jgi:hypothetical protein
MVRTGGKALALAPSFEFLAVLWRERTEVREAATSLDG